MKLYLKETPQARERKNKVRAIGNIMRKTHPSIQAISPEVMDGIVDEIIDYERYWRKILLDEPTLRGKDYNTKRIVEQKKMLELGVVEMGFKEELPF